MSVHIEQKDSFAVIGKLGQGAARDALEWISPLWQEANVQFEEIRGLAKTDNEGNLAGLWGAMSDLNETFERWSEQGKYLAGCEVLDDSLAPAGWTKWTIPAYTYAVIECRQTEYHEKFAYMLDTWLPDNGYSLVGAVHEFYKPGAADGALCLYFPIEKQHKIFA